SMVEKETLSPDERPLVAAVIYNRLHARMPVGIDATLRYGFNIPPTESIRQSQIDSHSPYNTRKRQGLTPTPIANPGLASMQDAAFAARGLDWAYVPLPVAAERLEEALRGLVALGFAGANVTAPHKEAAARLCDEAEGDAVNTLVIRDGRIVGSNTDREIVA